MNGQKRGSQGFRGRNGFCGGHGQQQPGFHYGQGKRGLRRGEGLGICAFRADDSTRLEQLKASKVILDKEITLLEESLAKKA